MFSKILELQRISGKKDKASFIVDNTNDEVFVAIMKFLLDNTITTGIDVKKWDKCETEPSTDIWNKCTTFTDTLDFVKENNTGRNEIVATLKVLCETYFDKEIDFITYKQIMTKTLTVGVSDKTWNKLVSDELKVPYSPYMGCQSYSPRLINKIFQSGAKIYSQTKEDGAFLNVIVDGGKVKSITGRKGFLLNFMDAKFIQDINNCYIHNKSFVLIGELLIDGMNDRSEANGIIRAIDSLCKKIYEGESLKLKDKFTKKYGDTLENYLYRLRFTTWDLVSIGDFNKGEGSVSYNLRFEDLNSFVEKINSPQIKVVYTKIVNNIKEAMEHFKENLANGLEGTVLKSGDCKFKDGKPQEQIKMKVEFNLDLKITGFNIGKQGTKYANTLGSIKCESACGKLVANVSGIKDEMRDEIWSERELLLGKIVEIKCNGMSSNREGGFSVLYPNFIEIRYDKDSANTHAECLEIEDMVLNLGGK